MEVVVEISKEVVDLLAERFCSNRECVDCIFQGNGCTEGYQNSTVLSSDIQPLIDVLINGRVM